MRWRPRELSTVGALLSLVVLGGGAMLAGPRVWSLDHVLAQQMDSQERFTRFLASIIPDASRGPLSDPRVRGAIEVALVHNDRERAKQLLAEAGWPNGFRIALSTSRFGGTKGEVQRLQQDLQAIAVDLQLRQ